MGRGAERRAAVADLGEAVRSAIRNPIGSPSLSELVLRHGKRTLILVDDSTRSTPQSLILTILLDELNAAGSGRRRHFNRGRVGYAPPHESG